MAKKLILDDKLLGSWSIPVSFEHKVEFPKLARKFDCKKGFYLHHWKIDRPILAIFYSVAISRNIAIQ